MATTQESAVLSLHVYTAHNDNKPRLPENWTRLTGGEGTGGFAYAVFKNTSTLETVIAFRGSDDGADWLTNSGMTFTQEKQAAIVATQYINLLGSNVSFTGHSLGGGLAGTMAVWFNRSAIVFDPAPTQDVATNKGVVNSIVGTLGSAAPPSFVAYNGNVATQFAAREANVSSYYAPGSVVFGLSTPANTVTGPGQGNPVDFGIANMGGIGGKVDMHSQALLTAGVLSQPFADATVAAQTALPIIMDKKFYNLPTSGSAPNFLIDIIRSEQTTPSSSKLTKFSEDLQKLGTNIAGLNKQAQDAIIAQGIEWYYWQGTGYAGEKFFVNNATYPSLLQYTTAAGAALPNALDKASSYTRLWLSEVYTANSGDLKFPPFGSGSYQEWSVATTTAVTVTARDATKTQLYIGATGADTLTGGNKNDVILAGAGNDSITGGTGADLLYGSLRCRCHPRLRCRRPHQSRRHHAHWRQEGGRQRLGVRRRCLPLPVVQPRGDE